MKKEKDLAAKYLDDKLDLLDADLGQQIKQLLQDQQIALVVLDDDPTGTQTVHHVPVLTTWSEEDIQEQLQEGIPLFYILTNSRGCSEARARQINSTIGKYLKTAAEKFERKVLVISRSDSTLRGHYPLEMDVLQESLGYKKCLKILAMTFIEGGRFTIDDVHYILQENQLIPVSDTPFAKDKTFGYQNADLKQYVEEKTNGLIIADNVKSFSLAEIQNNSVDQLTQAINDLNSDATCVLNSVSYQDLQKFSLALLNAKQPFIIRSAASIIPAIAGMNKRSLLKAEKLNLTEKSGSLIIVGSHVPLSSSQLSHLLKNEPVCRPLEFEVKRVIAQEIEEYIISLARKVNDLLAEKQDVVLYTTRELISANERYQSLSISRLISENLIKVVQKLNIKPAFILAKGSITSSDIATDGLSVKKVEVLGQIIPGVSVWQLGGESKFPGLSYVVFPGNVGKKIH